MSVALIDNAIHKYRGVADKIPEEWLLGDLVSFTVPESDVPIRRAHEELERLGLPEAHMRMIIRPKDAWSKATKDIEHRFPKHENGVKSEFMVKDGGHDEYAVYRFVVLERLLVERGKRRRLAFESVARLTFHRGTKNDDGEYVNYSLEARRLPVDFSLSTQEEAWVNTMLAGLENRFQHNLHHLDSHAVRRYIVQTLQDLRSVGVKETGGFYFVQQRHHDTVRRLQEWTKAMGAGFHTIPLVDLEDQRQMLLDAYEDETIGEIERQMAEIAKILKDPKRTIRQDTHDQMMNLAADLLAKTGEYEELLDESIDTVRTQAEVFRNQVLELATRVSG